jgi:hypothetical protein
MMVNPNLDRGEADSWYRFFNYHLNLPLKDIFLQFLSTALRKLTSNDKNLEILMDDAALVGSELVSEEALYDVKDILNWG